VKYNEELIQDVISRPTQERRPQDPRTTTAVFEKDSAMPNNTRK